MIERDPLTKVFLQQSGKSIDDVNVRVYSRKWWRNQRGGQTSFRLSDDGFQFLTEELKLLTYVVPFGRPVSAPSELVFLDRYLTCPYYLELERVTVFSERKCLELSFFSDDIKRYGAIKAMTARLNSTDDD